MSGCPILTPEEYNESYDRIRHYIHCKLCQYYVKLDDKKWYRHQPEIMIERKEATILRNFVIQTDEKIKSNKQGKVFKNNKRLKKNISSN